MLSLLWSSTFKVIAQARKIGNAKISSNWTTVERKFNAIAVEKKSFFGLQKNVQMKRRRGKRKTNERLLSLAQKAAELYTEEKGERKIV